MISEHAQTDEPILLNTRGINLHLTFESHQLLSLEELVLEGIAFGRLMTELHHLNFAGKIVSDGHVKGANSQAISVHIDFIYMLETCANLVIT